MSNKVHKLNLAGQIGRLVEENNNSNVQAAKSDSPRAKLAQLEELKRQLQGQIEEAQRQIHEREHEVARKGEKQLTGKEKDCNSELAVIESREDLPCESQGNLEDPMFEQLIEGIPSEALSEEVKDKLRKNLGQLNVQPMTISSSEALIAERDFILGAWDDMELTMSNLIRICDPEPMIHMRASKNPCMGGYQLSLENEFILSLSKDVLGFMAHLMLSPKFDVQDKNSLGSSSDSIAQAETRYKCREVIRIICEEKKETMSRLYPDYFGPSNTPFVHNQEAINCFMRYVTRELWKVQIAFKKGVS